MNRKIGIIAFMTNLIPSWFSGLAPIFLLMALISLVVFILSNRSDRINRSPILKSALYVFIFLGTAFSIGLICELLKQRLPMLLVLFTNNTFRLAVLAWCFSAVVGILHQQHFSPCCRCVVFSPATKGFFFNPQLAQVCSQFSVLGYCANVFQICQIPSLY